MRVWRITKEKYVPAAFSGVGAEWVGGRWNHQGSKMVYASASLSLAALELFIHLEPYLLPDDLCAVSANIPDSASIEEIEPAMLPTEWQAYPAPDALKNLGTRWLAELRSFVLVVPSAVNPQEKNILLNPLHPEIASVSGIESQPFHFDPRMRKY